MKLFKYENYNIVISEEALLIKPFRAIWNRDRSKHKEKALLELGFIYFFCDPRSDYAFLIDEEDKKSRIIEQEGFDKKWKPDSIVLDGIVIYKELTTTTASLLLDDVKYTINNLRQTLRDIDLNERDEKGKPVYALNMITATIKQIPQLVKDLVETERVISKELEDNSKMRGQGVKKIFEDGIN